ncbi:PGF-CTERM sorting domain-containing protein [Haloarchaeobius sp. HRN-SO-5]|uniref:PGF-CTERM sorting domain-containing protein n=1 Tax=Haloarchaeobius sp. HRN-SO-5 TaxID=3446118 RepID=UPI003EBA600C
MRTHNRALLAVTLAALLLTSTVGAVAVGGQSGQSALNGAQAGDAPDAADEIYVEEDGDAVLVYRNDEGSANGHFGADLSEGLFHVFLNDTMDEAPEDNVSGSATLELGPEELTGEGAFSMDTPDSVEELTFDASGEQTRENAQGSMTLDATFLDESSTTPRGTSMFESLSTEGTMTSSASSFSSEGSVSTTFSQNPGVGEMSHSFTLEETDDAYVLSGAQDYVVGSYSADHWNTESSAQRSLEAQFGAVARQLDGDVSVTLDSHSFDSSTNRLDIEYTVEFTGVDQAVSEQLATSLASSRNLDLSQAEADDLAERIQSVELTELSGSVDVDAEQATVSWNVQIDNADEAALAMFDVVEAAETEQSQVDVEKMRTRFEAGNAADLRQTVTWNGSFSSSSSDTVEVQFEADYRTENWQDYVDELESRDVEWSGETTFEAHAETEDGELSVDASATVSQEGLVNDAIDTMLEEGARSGTDQTAANEQTTAFLEAFQRSDFERAKMEVSMENRTVTLEAGASFDNVSAFRDVMEDEYGNITVASAYGEIEDGEGVTYVRVSGAVGEDASESDVRDLSVVDDDTEVNMPGDWDPDERDFPEMDEAEARNFLAVDDSGGTFAAVPGFGPALALVALAAVALFARRRIE